MNNNLLGVMENVMLFEGYLVEVFEYEGKVLFNPRDVAKCLDIKDINSTLRNFNNKQVIKLRNSDMYSMHSRKLNNVGENFLTESGVYKLIFKSRKENAERFQDWVTDEVLPQIRQTGGYIPVKQEETNEEFLARAFLIAQETIQKKDKIIELQKPKADYYDKVLDSSKLISVTDIAKDLGMTARELNLHLEQLGIQFKKTNPKGRKVGTWKLKSKYDYLISDGYADYHIYIDNHSPQCLKWTEKGREWIINILEDNYII